ncbi:hypothetical protein BGX24_004140 [Mortierella sp. AD032]|nr:hypothetical protein BGX24_004140 [Mortierella sp. AD032]
MSESSKRHENIADQSDESMTDDLVEHYIVSMEPMEHAEPVAAGPVTAETATNGLVDTGSVDLIHALAELVLE